MFKVVAGGERCSGRAFSMSDKTFEDGLGITVLFMGTDKTATVGCLNALDEDAVHEMLLFLKQSTFILVGRSVVRVQHLGTLMGSSHGA